MKSSIAPIIKKIETELSRKGIKANQIEILSAYKGEQDLSHKLAFMMLFKSELQMYKAWDMYLGSGARKGYSENLKAYYVTVGN